MYWTDRTPAQSIDWAAFFMRAAVNAAAKVDEELSYLLTIEGVIWLKSSNEGHDERNGRFAIQMDHAND